MLGSSAASATAAEATSMANRDLRVRCIVIKLSCLVSAKRNGTSKSYSKRRECGGLSTWLFPLASTVVRPS
jgi:hypothetical protein